MEGAVEILQNRKFIDFVGLHCGKISLYDLQRPSIAKKLKKDKIKLPSIMDSMRDYMAALDRIAAVNHIK